LQPSFLTVIHLAIPNSAIESLSATELVRAYWPSEDWKKLVFHCRIAKRLPAELRKFKDAALIIGTIASKPNFVYEKMKSSDEIVEKMVLKTQDGRNAAQYVFSLDDGEEFLEDHGVGRLRVFPITGLEYEDWHASMAESLMAGQTL
jgi:hypothetical protein